MIRNIAYVAIAALFCQGLTSVRAFLLAKLISPAEYGVWTGLQLIITLAPIACLGTVEALVKEVAFYRGKGDKETQTAVEASVLGSVILAGVIIILGCYGLQKSGWFKFFQEHARLARLTAVTAALITISSFYYYRTVAYENFRLVSVLDTVRAIVSTAAILLPGAFFGLEGAVIGLLISEVLSAVLLGALSSRDQGSVRISFSGPLMWNAIRIGLPITLIWWIYMLQNGLGRMASMAWLGSEVTGYLGAAGSLATMVALVPNMVARVFYPRLNAQLGANTGAAELRKSVIDPVTSLAVILPFAQLAAVFVLPLIYRGFLAKYAAGLDCGQILVMGAFFACIVRNGLNFLIASNRQMLLIGYVIGTCLLSAAFIFGLVKLDFGINGIAVAVSAAAAILSAFVWSRVFNELHIPSREQAALAIKMFGPFFLAAIVSGALNWAFDNHTASVVSILSQLFASLILYVALCLLPTSIRCELSMISRRGRALIFTLFQRLSSRPG